MPGRAIYHTADNCPPNNGMDPYYGRHYSRPITNPFSWPSSVDHFTRSPSSNSWDQALGTSQAQHAGSNPRVLWSLERPSGNLVPARQYTSRSRSRSGSRATSASSGYATRETHRCQTTSHQTRQCGDMIYRHYSSCSYTRSTPELGRRSPSLRLHQHQRQHHQYEYECEYEYEDEHQHSRHIDVHVCSTHHSSSPSPSWSRSSSRSSSRSLQGRGHGHSHSHSCRGCQSRARTEDRHERVCERCNCRY